MLVVKRDLGNKPGSVARALRVHSKLHRGGVDARGPQNCSTEHFLRRVPAHDVSRATTTAVSSKDPCTRFMILSASYGLIRDCVRASALRRWRRRLVGARCRSARLWDEGLRTVDSIVGSVD
jgi:hypothetical protein